MLATCSQCHSDAFAKSELAKGDDMIREADHLMAEAIRIVAGLYKDGVAAEARRLRLRRSPTCSPSTTRRRRSSRSSS